MAAWETKLKLGRKLEGVDSQQASDNQVSALFRYDAAGKDAHVSLSVESDRMTVHDVVAVLKLLDERGVLRRGEAKTWVNQPQASAAKFGPTSKWQDVDLDEVVLLLDRGLPVRDAQAASAASATAATDPGAARAALAKLDEVEKRLAELRAALGG